MAADGEEEELLLGMADLGNGDRGPDNSRSAAATAPGQGAPPASAAGMDAARRRGFIIGLLLLVAVVVIWVASSELTKYIFSKENFDKPFFLTYLNASCFSFYLLGFLVRPSWRARLRTAYRSYTQGRRRRAQGGGGSGAAARLRSDPPAYIPVVNSGGSGDGTSTGSSRSGDPGDDSSSSRGTDPANELSLKAIIRTALVFSVLWFIANYTYSLSLDETTVSSNTILSSTSGFFTLILGAIFPGTATDRFTPSKLVIVLLSIGGVVLVSISDSQHKGNSDKKGKGAGGDDDDSSAGHNTIAGDVLALFSALMYACYLVFLRKATGSKEIDMPMFLGFVGLYSLVLLWPVLLILNYTRLEVIELPDRTTWLSLLLNAFIGTVLSEVLWLWATLLTSPVISTLAISLTIPLAIVGDIILNIDKASLSWMYILGTLMVLGAFFLINLTSFYPDYLENRWRAFRRRFGDGDRSTSPLLPAPAPDSATPSNISSTSSSSGGSSSPSDSSGF